jgi:pimeloyl-ACP methyl ester carboxylesterase
MSDVATSTVSVNGVSSPILQTGDPQATEAVVFVHGNPGPKEDWQDLLERTGEFARAVAPDIRVMALPTSRGSSTTRVRATPGISPGSWISSASSESTW